MSVMCSYYGDCCVICGNHCDCCMMVEICNEHGVCNVVVIFRYTDDYCMILWQSMLICSYEGGSFQGVGIVTTAINI